LQNSSKLKIMEIFVISFHMKNCFYCLISIETAVASHVHVVHSNSLEHKFRFFLNCARQINPIDRKIRNAVIHLYFVFSISQNIEIWDFITKYFEILIFWCHLVPCMVTRWHMQICTYFNSQTGWKVSVKSEKCSTNVYHISFIEEKIRIIKNHKKTQFWPEKLSTFHDH
jgi:hypothetical protein